jgi:MoaA/NifB/PqqE/SkfB family radical SAM enzyme
MTKPQMHETLLYDGDNVVASLGSAHNKWVIWHVTRGCNIECDYCYGSFAGTSYKKDFIPSNDIPVSRMLEIADEISKLGFEYVHLNGGETFLRRDIWSLIERLAQNKIKTWALTNATFVQKEFEENFSKGYLHTLAFSLDSIRPEYGNYVRDKTEAVISNVKRIAELKKKENVTTRLGMYVVLTKKNLNLVEELFDWAIDLGIEYINMQPVYLPPTHKLFNELCFSDSDHNDVMEKLSSLKKKRALINTSSNALLTLTDFMFTHQKTSAGSCFANRGDYLYIDGFGNVYGCPSKPPSANKILGNIKDDSLLTLYRSIDLLDQRKCPFVSLDCLGMYEMAYQSDYKQTV